MRAPCGRTIAAAALIPALGGLAAASSSSNKAGAHEVTRGETVTLLTHDAWAVSKPVLAAFTKQTGIKVKVLRQGDAGAMVNQAILTRDHPQADALFGVDNTFLSRALDHNLFEARTYQGRDTLRPQARQAFASALGYVVPV